jgi:beta-glucosidase
LNEPWVSAFLGYGYGIHAPGKKDMKGAFISAHNLLLAHGLAVNAYRDGNYKGKIGITLNLSPIYSVDEREENIKAKVIQDAFVNRLFLDPLFLGKYPDEIIPILIKNRWNFNYNIEDLKIISIPIDFLGVNYYSRIIVKFSKDEPFFNIEWVKGSNEVTDMNWEIYPKGLYDLLIRLHKDYRKTIYITENGCAFNDIPENGKIKDEKRINYLREHIKMAYYAIRDGVDLKGYFIWTLMDNFEWAFGFSKRFGIVYTDYSNQKRILKDSAYFYKDVISNNGLIL